MCRCRLKFGFRSIVQALNTSIFCWSAMLALMLLLDSLFTVMKIRELVQQALRITYLTLEAEN
jgi:hypothetical protein